jgi:asparagine synthase (glutamine-hydrolysing)
MLSAMFLRTAESSSRWDGPNVSLGHKLVITVPEDRYDRQPAGGSQTRYVVVADVRLDNRAEVASALGLNAAECGRLSDGALVAAGVERWNEDAFDRFVGAFAVAAWDTIQRRLILARDIVGERPLFFHQSPDFTAFATMPGGLHALPQIPKAPDVETVTEFLGMICPRTTRSYFKGVERVLPAHFCVLADGRMTMTRYWRPRTTPLRLARHEDYVEALRSHLDTAVAAQLRGSDGHVGAHLSSGLDSSAVATSAARLLAPTGGRVTAFTACPRDGYSEDHPPGEFDRLRLDESGPAAATAALHPNMSHVLVRAGGTTPLDDLDRTSTLYGRPVLNLCNSVWLDAINEEARGRGLKVLLTGQFGNSSLSFAGDAALPELFARGQYGKWLHLARALVRRGSMRWSGVLFNTLAPWLPGPVASHLLSLVGRGGAPLERHSPLRPELFDDLYASAPSDESRWGSFARDGLVERQLALITDQSAMGKGVLAWWGVDWRDPTADRRLIEFCLTVPTEQFIYDGEPKALIKHALSGRVSPEVLNSRQKGYQGADWHESLTPTRARLEDELDRMHLIPETRGLIDVERLRGLLRRWPSQGWVSPEVVAEYRVSLLRAVSAADFMRRASGSNL